MAKTWSFNTTVRNPERMQNFLRTLQAFEGRIFDEDCQKDFFAMQIKKRLYKPTSRTLVDISLINEVNKKTAEEIPDDVVNRIIKIYQDRNADASLRGRTTAGILNRFGLCVASKSRGPVEITTLGNEWLNYKINDQELFFKFLLKWQYPNPLEQGYREFNIKPFIATLSLIDKVNKIWAEKGENPVGISKKEFMLFIPSLRNYQDIEKYVLKIIEYRLALKQRSGDQKNEYDANFTLLRIEEIFGHRDNFLKLSRDLKDYTDSAIRYFRMTNFIYLRGNDTHVDIAPNYKVEIERLIQSDDASARSFAHIQEYLDYLVNEFLPVLPWENEDDLLKIKNEIIESCRILALETNKEPELQKILKSFNTQKIKDQIEKLKDFKNSLQIEKLRGLKYNKKKLKELISRIPRILSDRTQTVTTRPSLDLEWFISLSLMILNDANNIIPSFKLGDDGLPTGFASNIADIECLYNNFGMIVEVTLLMNRDQWFAEGQPVMRHLRDFEDKYSLYGEKTYCLFIAPFLHRDTLNTFWGAIKGIGYEGRKQIIIPLRIDQYVKILNIIYNSFSSNAVPTHENYEKLFRMLHENCSNTGDVFQWVETFDSTIDKWGNTLY